MQERYQLVASATGQSLLPVTLQNKDAAIKIADNLSRELAIPIDVLEIKPVHSTTVIVSGAGIIVPKGGANPSLIGRV